MKKEDKITIEQVLKSRVVGTASIGPSDSKEVNSKLAGESKINFETQLGKFVDETHDGGKNYHRKVQSKDRASKNQSYVDVSKRRQQSIRKEEPRRKEHNQSFNYDPRRTYATEFRNNYEREAKRNFDVEAYNDPVSYLQNANILVGDDNNFGRGGKQPYSQGISGMSHPPILNVVSPKEQPGFHITDLLASKKHERKTPKLSETELGADRSIFEGFSFRDHKLNLSTPNSSLAKTADRYMIKNFKVVNLNSERQSERDHKPITAARMTYNDSGARSIKKITSGASSRKTRFNSTSNAFRGTSTPHELPVSNSLLSPDEKGQYTDMRPIHNYFDQLYEETHYMFPKNKAKFGLQTAYNTPFLPNRSVSLNKRAKTGDVPGSALISNQKLQLEELRIKTIEEETPKDEDKETTDQGELEYLLGKSLVYHKQRISKKNTPLESLTDEDKLNIIMNSWFTDDRDDPAYALDVAETESRLTSHMIINTRNNKSIYPEAIKDAEIDIYLRNRKNVPKYELLQYMKFTHNNEMESKTKDSSSPMEGKSGKSRLEEPQFDLNVGCVNPLTNTRLLLSFKLNCEFLDHVTPDFASPEHLPHSIFDDCSNEIEKILRLISDRKQKGDFLWAYSPYINEDGSMTDCKVKVLEFDFDRDEFLIEFEDKYKISELHSYEFLQHKDLSRISKLQKY